jgi:hypothetical protein
MKRPLWIHTINGREIRKQQEMKTVWEFSTLDGTSTRHNTDTSSNPRPSSATDQSKVVAGTTRAAKPPRYTRRLVTK